MCGGGREGWFRAVRKVGVRRNLLDLGIEQRAGFNEKTSNKCRTVITWTARRRCHTVQHTKRTDTVAVPEEPTMARSKQCKKMATTLAADTAPLSAPYSATCTGTPKTNALYYTCHLHRPPSQVKVVLQDSSPVLPALQSLPVLNLSIIRLVKHNVRPLRLLASSRHARLIVDQDASLDDRLIPCNDNPSEKVLAQVTTHPSVLFRHARLPLEGQRSRAEQHVQTSLGHLLDGLDCARLRFERNEEARLRHDLDGEWLEVGREVLFQLEVFALFD